MIWGGQTEWTITQSGTWTVPKTGRYYMELYGGGGGAGNSPVKSRGSNQAGSSCQSYDVINLTSGDSITVSIGTGGRSDYLSSAEDSTGTTFGTYSVAGGGKATSEVAGVGYGNKGTNGTFGASEINKSSGTWGDLYGYGGYYYRGSQSSKSNGGPGAVYLKYLGV